MEEGGKMGKKGWKKGWGGGRSLEKSRVNQ